MPPCTLSYLQLEIKNAIDQQETTYKSVQDIIEIKTKAHR